jgi:histidyl-tRNA synthetase
MSNPLSTNPIPGTRDFFPEDMSVRVQVFEVLYRIVESYGYLRYDGPILEPFELYAAKSGQELVNTQIYRLTDRGGRDLAIRPEMTPTVARMIAARTGQLTLPVRWYSHPNLYRYERKQRGRYREHWQVNVDVFGTESWEAEAEVFELLAEMMFALGARTEDFLLRISDRKVMEAILLGYAAVPPDKLREAYFVLDQLDKVPTEESSKRLVELGLDADRILRVASSSADELFKMAPPEVVERSGALRVMREGLVTSKPVDLRFDPKIIRAFDYYTSTVFEIYDTDPANRRSIVGGGRYDNLVGLFGRTPIPGIGFGMGDVTLIDFLETHGILPRPRLASDAMVIAPRLDAPPERRRVKEIAAELRAAGLRVTTSLEGKKMGKLLERASKEGIRFVVIAGDDESSRGAAKLRDLRAGTEKEVPRPALAEEIRRGLAE